MYPECSVEALKSLVTDTAPLGEKLVPSTDSLYADIRIEFGTYVRVWYPMNVHSSADCVLIEDDVKQTLFSVCTSASEVVDFIRTARRHVEENSV